MLVRWSDGFGSPRGFAVATLSPQRGGLVKVQNDENRAIFGPILSQKPRSSCGFALSAPSGFRTPDPLIKSQLLYQLS